MFKREKELFTLLIDDEEKVLADLARQYEKALEEIGERIKAMMADDMTQSRIYRIEYQKALKAQVEAILEKLHGDEYSTIQEYVSRSYTNGFVGAMYSMAGQGVPIIAPIDQRAAVQAIVTDSKLSAPLYAALGYDIDKVKKTIRQEITRGIAQNMSYTRIAKNIANRTNMPLSRAQNIAQTEGHRIQQASSDNARHVAKEKGADVLKQWDSTMDMATRPVHRQLDGQVREVDEYFEAGGYKALYPGTFGKPEMDCRCRCVATTRARWGLDQKELDILKERAAYWGLDKSGDFDDFKRKYLKATESEK